MNISSLQKKYPLVDDINEEDLDPNSSLKKMLTLIGKKQYVIDFGCATGYFARLLTKRECQVVGVEINSQAAKVADQYCESVIIADLDYVSLSEILPNVKFDIAVFGDVLEHLRDPWRVLKEVHSFLKPQGYVVASIPNIAHGSIRLALLQGKFDYTELGILDNTHLRFFTRETAENMFEETGYCVHTLERTKLPIFSGSNWIPLIDKNKFNNQVIEQVEQDEEADTFQFIIKAVPSSIENKYILLKEKYSKLTKYYSEL
ncbi:MAG: class I SAM-dependent methyltransferase, partial [Sphaerospermopsis kisseleviana]